MLKDHEWREVHRQTIQVSELPYPLLPTYLSPSPQCLCEFLDLASHKTDQHLLKCVYKHIYFIYFNVSIFMGFIEIKLFFLPSMKT